MNRKLTVAAATLSLLAAGLVAHGKTFTTASTPGTANRHIDTEGVNGPGTSDAIYGSVGLQNTYYNMNMFLWAQMPTVFATNVTVVCPVTLRGTLSTANIDIWYMGNMDTVSVPSPAWQYAVGWHVWDDVTPMRPYVDGKAVEHYYYLNDRAPVKVVDDALPKGTYVNWGAGQGIGEQRYPAPDLLTQIGLEFNRGVKADSYALIRLNPDERLPGGEVRFAAWKSTSVDEQGNPRRTTRLEFSASDADVSPLVEQLDAEARTSENYAKRAVTWVQYEEDGTRGFEYPAWGGVRGGVARDLVFLVPFPEYTVEQSWLSLQLLAPAEGNLPSGAKVSLVALGVVPEVAKKDMLISAADLEGQTPVLIAENVLPRTGLAEGAAFRLSDVQQRDLQRWINATVVSRSQNLEERTGLMAVLKLKVEDASAATDWRFGLASVATPGLSSFLETVDYRVMKQIVKNPGFEDGKTSWSLGNRSEVSDVVVDPTDPENHCLRLCNYDTAVTSASAGQNTYNAGYEWLNGRKYVFKMRVYQPSSAPLTSASEFVYGIMQTWHKNASGSNVGDRWSEGKKMEMGSPCDQWIEKSVSGTVKSKVNFGFNADVSLRMTANSGTGATAYVDDVEVWVEDFYQVPKEKTGLLLILR